MQRRAIEFHDSEMLSAALEGSDLKLRLSAYVHVSEGVPGQDAGTGWIQPVQLVMTNAQVEGSLPAARVTIASGRLAVGDRRFDGILPLPFEATGDVRLEINGLAANLTATAEAVSVRPIGEARFVEEFRP